MALPAGTRLGPYEILAPLGAGGMGEVYRARDTKLGRDVAVKVLPADSLSDESARRHFRREAEALVRLSHPHIATIHDFDTANGTDFLVMELVRGHSVRNELRAKGALPEKTVVRLGTQLARGLQAAHEQGIIHCDLKPSNLQLTPDGSLKILDFGLARLLPKKTEPGEASAPTQTAAGGVAGTLPYMAPEQLRGRNVDERMDLYAAGAVLYEMATGKRLFSKPSSAELTDAILNEQPASPRVLNERVSAGLDAVILKALDKDAELRHQTARDLLVDLERLQQPAPTGRRAASMVPSAVRRRRLLLWGTLSAVVILMAVGWKLRPVPAPRVLEIRPITRGLGARVADSMGSPSWATDGERLFYLAVREGRARLTQTPVSGGEPREIQPASLSWMAIQGYLHGHGALLVVGTEHPESLSAEDEGMPLWLVPVPGGATHRIGSLLGWSAAASPDEKRLAVIRGSYSDRSLGVAHMDGSAWKELVRLPAGALDPRWAPTGGRLRFGAVGPPGHEGEPWIWETSSSGDTPRPLWPGLTGNWAEGGRYFVFSRVQEASLIPRLDLFAVWERAWPPWSKATPIQLTSGPVNFLFPGPSGEVGRLFARGAMARGELQRYDAQTGRFEPFLRGESVQHVEPSPDGEWLAWVSYPEGVLWKGRSDGSARQRLTGKGLMALLPRWSPNGRELVFVGREGEETWFSLQRVSADGTHREVLARPQGDGHYWSPCWLPDGETVLYSRIAGPQLGVFQLDLRSREVSVLPGADRLQNPRCSAQGHVLATGQAVGGAPRTLKVRWNGQSTWREIGLRGWAYPSWTRDGKSIVGIRSDLPQIERLDIRTGRRTVVVDLEGIPLVVLVTAPWMGLAADDSPLVLREHGNRDLYALDWEAP